MDKTVVKEHIVLAAAKSFAQKGVKTVRMDDILLPDYLYLNVRFMNCFMTKRIYYLMS